MGAACGPGRTAAEPSRPRRMIADTFTRAAPERSTMEMMTRREWLHTASAGVAALVPFGTVHADDEGAVPAIDAHTHFYDPTRPEGVPWPDERDELLYRRVLPDEIGRASCRERV